jgi:hypothetical protein
VKPIWWKVVFVFMVVSSNLVDVAVSNSNVLEGYNTIIVKRNKNTTVTFNNGTNGIYPGQSVEITIYNPIPPPIGSEIKTAFIPAKDRVDVYINGTKDWIALSQSSKSNIQKWDTNTTNRTIVTERFDVLNPGWHKVVVLVNNIVIGVSKQILIMQPYIQLPIPKRTYSQWEPIPLKKYYNNPYFDDSDTYMYRKEYIFILEVLPINFIYNPKNYEHIHVPYLGFEIGPTSIRNGGDSSFILPFQPGLYNANMIVHREKKNTSYEYYVEKIVPIRNTTFRILEKHATLTITNLKPIHRYNDRLALTLTTSNKVLFNATTFWIYSVVKGQVSNFVGQLQHSKRSTDLTMIKGFVHFYQSSFDCVTEPTLQVQIFVTADENSDVLRAYSNQTIVIDQTSRVENCDFLY